VSELISTNSLFDTQEGRDALAKASSVFMQAASESEGASDADKFLAIGGVLHLPDRSYAAAFLEMVNYNLEETNVAAMVSSGERVAGTRLPPEELDQLVKTLGEIKKDPRRAAASHAKEWRSASYGRVFKISDFSTDTGRLQADDRKIILGGYAAFAYVLQILTAQPLCDQLRRCELESCGRFFLFEPDGRGAPPRYCIDTDHAKEALRIQTRNRVREYRKTLKKKRGKTK
jgi:hypothetical protein